MVSAVGMYVLPTGVPSKDVDQPAKVYPGRDSVPCPDTVIGWFHRVCNSVDEFGLPDTPLPAAENVTS